MFSSFSGSFRAGRRPSAAVTGTSMRDLLSVAGKTAYDAASSDSWFNVSAADYAAVLAGLSGASSIGMPTSEVNTATPSAFVGTYGITLPQASATVPAGSYVIGFVVRGTSASAATLRPYVSTTYKGTYTTLGSNSVTTAAVTTPVYYLRKSPTAQASTSYVAMGPRSAGSGNWASSPTLYANSGYSANMSSWTIWNGALPIQQWIISTSAP